MPCLQKFHKFFVCLFVNGMDTLTDCRLVQRLPTHELLHILDEVRLEPGNVHKLLLTVIRGDSKLLSKFDCHETSSIGRKLQMADLAEIQ